MAHRSNSGVRATLATLALIALGAGPVLADEASEMPMEGMDHNMPMEGMDHGGHGAATSATGSWAYTAPGRENPQLSAARFEMVPALGTRGQEWVSAAALDRDARCRALIANSLVAVDAATRAACAGEGATSPVLMAPIKLDSHEHGEHEDMDMPMHGPHWMAPDAEQNRPNPVPVTDDSLARAAEVFEDSCAVCHGPKGAGNGPAAAALEPPPADLKMMAGMHTPGDLHWKIATGRNAMPPWGEMLDDRTIWDLVNYLQKVIGAGKGGENPAHDEDGHEHHHHEHHHHHE